MNLRAKKYQKVKKRKERLNSEITVEEVRVVDEDGTQLGILPTGDALRVSEDKGLDLVEVAPMAKPPVCRIMDYGKLQFQKSKKASQAKKKQQVIHVKEVKFRPNTDAHDFDFKIHHAERFLKDGNKAKVTLMFRGREVMYAERGRKVLEGIAERLAEISVIEQMPTKEGRNMVMILAPKAKPSGSQTSKST